MGSSQYLQGKSTAGSTESLNIADGISNTLLLLEVNAANAAPWTKPDDLSSDAGEISKMTGGIRDGNRFLVIFCDGSDQMLSSDSTELLKALLTKHGGEVIAIPNLR